MSDDENTQIKPGQFAGSTELPDVIRMTPIERAIFGFSSEVRRSASFVNDQYLVTLASIEAKLNEAAARVAAFALGASVFTITTANDALGDTSYFGLYISAIPYLTEFSCLVLSILVMLLCHLYLDSYTLSRMRHEIFQVTLSECPNMRMAHYKNGGAWIDAFSPKKIGFSSSRTHIAFRSFGLAWSALLPATTLAMPLFAQAIGTASYSDQLLSLSLTAALLWTSIAISLSSIMVTFIAAFVKMRFTAN